MRVVFFGTPEFAIPTLEAVAREHEIALVVAQPDRPAGRGMKMHEPPLVSRARQLGLDVAQPPKIRDPEFLRRVEAIAPDAAVVIAYGKILPKHLLDIPREGFFNVHASVLPEYRGAAPVQRAIEAGETTTGVTIMRVDEELDHGPILAIEPAQIGPDERAPSLFARLSKLGGDLLVRTLRELSPGTPQDHSRATLAPKIEKHEGLITFSEPPQTIYNKFRAFDPWPGVCFDVNGESIKIIDLLPADRNAPAHGTLVVNGLRLITLQRPGKPKAPAEDVARGIGWP
ncbi:MAG TPA: methionyl-tRNA formyltransferase [Thermoanaerobaculia bacterium]